MAGPMNPRVRNISLVVLALAAVGATAAILGGQGKDATGPPTPSSSPNRGPRCLDTPPRISTPTWFPKNLVLPQGSHAVKDPFPHGTTYRQAVFAVPGTLRDFVAHVLRAWPPRGWTLGHGESETHEAEARFSRISPEIYGAFRAYDALCDADKTLVLIAIGNARSVAPVARPTGTASSSPFAAATR